MRPSRLFVALVLVQIVGAPISAQQEEAGACILCHSSEDWFDEEGISVVTDHAGSVHADVGISCADCHGGNDAVELLDDMEAAMDPGFEPNPYRGAPAPAEIPGFCGRCHSDLDYMRRFAPDARTDQENEYWTSAHGRALEAGDTAVATCTDCHGRHDILAVDAAESRVFAKNVHETCGSCHSSAEHMAGYDSIIDGLQDYIRKIAQGCTNKGVSPSRACLIVKTLLESSNTHVGLSEQAQVRVGHGQCSIEILERHLL